MSRLLVFQHVAAEPLGTLDPLIRRRGHRIRFKNFERHPEATLNTERYRGLIVLGGPMNVDEHPQRAHLRNEMQAIEAMLKQGKPVLGICLGAQLLAHVLGAAVPRNPVKEIGWGEVFGEADTTARHWLGDFAGGSGTVFHWHGETFSIPPGASRLCSNAYCANQMFALGPHLGMQCHVEMTPEMITSWSAHWADETTGLAKQPSIQTPEQMIGEAASRVAAMRKLSDQLYAVWIAGLAR